ncbi:D-tyrosyl-tRNA(Tyr) deacylase [Limnohabitans sp. TS-CS-82]|uniref:D-aminoacyl-tRNA deacylase n=1 Tax=Limnohabitans sp. TS-CS-82 TaxID=2094193 RepID=UPI000CF213C0|nr:D-aminoacyl-tRNA deacylase [Limnohabitans sp. TS-CS-82]PQA85210.1 D-tyrosyl-tRNA(Tyr) deacylase [Limnohabitans sp. TS-CS-82]
MKAVLQRVSEARVLVNGQTVGEIAHGLMVLLCAEKGDNEAVGQKMLDKILKLRVFYDDAGKMNRSVVDVNGGLLVVSQFTLAADTSSGTRPSFTSAAPADEGRRLYDAFVAQAKAQHPLVQTGIFGADMKVHLVNDGPVTIPITIIGA